MPRRKQSILLVIVFGLMLPLQALAISPQALNAALSRSELYSQGDCGASSSGTPGIATQGGVQFTTEMTIDDDGVGPSHGDPNHQSHTSYADGQLNADQTSYIALAPGWASAHGLQLGDVAMVSHAGKTAYAVYGDNYTGDQVHGEGSVHLSKALGGDASNTIPAPVNYTVYPDSHTQLNGSVDQTKIDQLGAQLSGATTPPGGSGGSCCGGGGTQLVGGDNETQIWNYFIGKGLSPIQTAAIVGNFKQESRWNPEDSQVDEKSHADPAFSGDQGWGLAQWSPGISVYAAATATGVKGNIDLLSTQLDIVWGQMKTSTPTSYSNFLTDFKRINDLASATSFFTSNFEGAGIIGPRLTYAQDALAKYAGPGAPPPAAGSVSSGGCSGSGSASQFINGFLIYSQYDPQWANLPYGNTTISAAGCGPSAMAMIITALTGKSVTPNQTANYATSQGLYVKGEGSSWSIGPVLAAHWGLKSSPLGADQAKIVAALNAGGLVIASGQGPLPFTKGGHFLVIRGVASNGKWYVGDSGHANTSDKQWDPNQLLASMNGGSVYAITQ